MAAGLRDVHILVVSEESACTLCNRVEGREPMVFYNNIDNIFKGVDFRAGHFCFWLNEFRLSNWKQLFSTD